MKKLIPILFILLIIVGCNSVTIGTPTSVPTATETQHLITNTPDNTATPKPSNTSTLTLTNTPTPTDTPTATEVLVVETFEPTATHEIYIYEPSETENISDDFIEIIAPNVNVRWGASVGSACVKLDLGVDPECNDTDREILHTGDIRKVYSIYYNATTNETWARIAPTNEPVSRWVSVDTPICRNVDRERIVCSIFK